MDIELDRPILLAGVTAKLDYKTWHEDRMAWTLQQFIKTYPEVQIIFNYACGKPSFVIVAPTTNKTTWLPQNDIPTDGIAITDIGGYRKNCLKNLTANRSMTSSPKKRYGNDGRNSSNSIIFFRIKPSCTVE